MEAGNCGEKSESGLEREECIWFIADIFLVVIMSNC